MRGLYVIRGGASVPCLVPRAKTKPDDEDTPMKPKGGNADDGRLGTLEVKFSKFDAWYRIDSFWEGTFLERTVPGAFKRTIANSGSRVKVLFNHGMDLHIGDKVLSVPEVLEERKDSPYLEGPLFDTSYNRDLLPGLRAGAYGSSFMFEVLGESWDNEPERSDYNPDGLPERTIHEVRLFEAGPVTWPANPEASAALRSGMDWYAEQVQQRDRQSFEDLVRSFTAFRALHGLRTSREQGEPAAPASPVEPKTPAPGSTPARHVDGVTAAARRRRLKLIDLAEATHDLGGAA
jgi:HK97 family phage prohead protease